MSRRVLQGLDISSFLKARSVRQGAARAEQRVGIGSDVCHVAAALWETFFHWTSWERDGKATSCKDSELEASVHIYVPSQSGRVRAVGPGGVFVPTMGVQPRCGKLFFSSTTTHRLLNSGRHARHFFPSLLMHFFFQPSNSTPRPPPPPGEDARRRNRDGGLLKLRLPLVLPVQAGRGHRNEKEDDLMGTSDAHFIRF